jgi:hypothetical protein
MGKSSKNNIGKETISITPLLSIKSQRYLCFTTHFSAIAIIRIALILFSASILKSMAENSKIYLFLFSILLDTGKSESSAQAI